MGHCASYAGCVGFDGHASRTGDVGHPGITRAEGSTKIQAATMT